MKTRFVALDGLRGLAAISVFFSHAIGLMFETDIVNALQTSPLHMLWDGASAVNLFFVLSGFVLALPYLNKRENPNYIQFCIRRFFRLYPAFWLAIIISLALRSGYDPTGMEALSEWSRSMWTSNVTLDMFLRHLTLMFWVDTRQMDPVAWTLIIEMRMSILLPVIIFALNFSRGLSIDLAIVAACLVLGNMVGVFTYLPLFVLGAVAAKYHKSWSLTITDMRIYWWISILCVGILLYGNRWIFPALTQFQQDIGSGFGSIIIILFTLSSKYFSNILSKPILQFMGHTSYSFYLLHLPLMLFFTSLLFPLTNSIILCSVLDLIFAYFLSYLVFRYIEQPMNELGRNVTKSLI